MANVQMSKQVFTSATGILMFPDNYQAKPHTFDPPDATAVAVGTKKVIKAGTIYPTNDAGAKGIVLYDVDVTLGSGTGAILFEGSVKLSKLPVAPAAPAKTALPRISFF